MEAEAGAPVAGRAAALAASAAVVVAAVEEVSEGSVVAEISAGVAQVEAGDHNALAN